MCRRFRGEESHWYWWRWYWYSLNRDYPDWALRYPEWEISTEFLPLWHYGAFAYGYENFSVYVQSYDYLIILHLSELNKHWRIFTSDRRCFMCKAGENSVWQQKFPLYCALRTNIFHLTIYHRLDTVRILKIDGQSDSRHRTKCLHRVRQRGYISRLTANDFSLTLRARDKYWIVRRRDSLSVVTLYK